MTPNTISRRPGWVAAADGGPKRRGTAHRVLRLSASLATSAGRAKLGMVGAALCALLWPAAGLRAQRPAALRCEWGAEPAGIDVAQPHLTWQLDGQPAGGASAWQVLVASSPEALAADRGDLWDSGRLPAGGGQEAVYGGAALHSQQLVHWKVRLWDGAGQPSRWSEPARWTMGITDPADWKGGWIAAPGATESLLLRREFTVRAALRRAVACVSGLGQYELFCNGRRTDGDFLSPGWTTYARTILYDTRDLTPLLRPGRNAFGLRLGNGMYNVVLRDRYLKFTGATGALRAILSLRLEYADGSVETIGTDPAWRTLAGPLTADSIYGGEDEDARLLPPGWNQPGFDDRRWLPAVAYRSEPRTLRGYTSAAPPLCEFQVHAPVGQRALPDGSVVYDFGQNTAHVPRLTVSGREGAAVKLTPAEIVDPDGSINQTTMGAGGGRGALYWTYTKGTAGAESWSPPFSYAGFRYLRVECRPAEPDGPAPRVERIAAVVVHSDAPEVGQFSASNPLLERIDQLVWWAQRANLMSVFTDCPDRERLGWLEETHLNGPALRYHFDLARNFRKSEHDMADAQTPEGLVPTIAPEYIKFDSPFRAAAEWGSAVILVPWQQYQFTGDTALLRQYYPAMKRYLGYLSSRAADDIVSEGLGDWYDLGPQRPGFAQLTGPDFTSTAFYCEDALILSRIAERIGEVGEAAGLAAQAERIRQSFNARFYHRETGLYASGSQCANAMALAMDLADPAERGRVLAGLVHDLEAHGGALTAGDVGYRYLLLALADGGRSDLIYRMINQDQTPGYAFILKQGATALTEAWDANRHASWDHFMLGQIIEWFYRDLAGIAPDETEPGFRRIVFRPSPVGDLTWVKADYASVRGPISAHWQRTEGKFSYAVVIPPGSSGLIYLPDSAGDAPTPAGTRRLRREADRTVFQAPAGHHTFGSSWKR